MKDFKHLIFDGRDYAIKKHIGFEVALFGLFIVIGFALIIFSTYIKTGISILAAIFIGIILSKTTHKSSQKIVMKNGKPEAFAFKFTTFGKDLIYPLKDVQSFQLKKIYYSRILILVQLFAEIEVDGKLKSIPIAHSIRVKPIQEMLNEIEELRAK